MSRLSKDNKCTTRGCKGLAEIDHRQTGNLWCWDCWFNYCKQQEQEVEIAKGGEA